MKFLAMQMARQNRDQRLFDMTYLFFFLLGYKLLLSHSTHYWMVGKPLLGKRGEDVVHVNLAANLGRLVATVLVRNTNPLEQGFLVFIIVKVRELKLNIVIRS